MKKLKGERTWCLKKGMSIKMENQIVENLNTFLADLAVFFRKLQNYHWNIKGKDFFVAHEKLQEYYETVNEDIDEIGEHILILGGEPLGTMKDYLEKTQIIEAKNQKIMSCEIYKNIKQDIQTLLKKTTEIKQQADKESNYATSSLMDSYIQKYSKILWMLSQQDEN